MEQAGQLTFGFFKEDFRMEDEWTLRHPFTNIMPYPAHPQMCYVPCLLFS